MVNLGKNFVYVGKEWLRLSNLGAVSLPEGFAFIDNKYIDLKRSKNFWGTDKKNLEIDIFALVEKHERTDAKTSDSSKYIHILTGEFMLPEGAYFNKYNNISRIGLKNQLTFEEAKEWREYRDEILYSRFMVNETCEDINFYYTLLDIVSIKKYKWEEIKYIELTVSTVNRKCIEETFYTTYFKDGTDKLRICASRLKTFAKNNNFDIEDSPYWVTNIEDFKSEIAEKLEEIKDEQI